MKKILLIILLLFPIFVYAKEEVKFSDCVDGDTIKVIINDEIKKVRLLAVDTPESVSTKEEVEYYGKESSEYTCNLITNSKLIELEYDPNSDKTDKYDRVLAWVFVDNELLQDLLVKNGYAEVAYLYGNYKYTSILESSELIAKSKNIGIWKDKYDYNDILILIGLSLLGLIYTYVKKKLKKMYKGSKILLN
jgi:micrococcal nuclease